MTKKYFVTATVQVEKRVGFWVEESDEESMELNIKRETHGDVQRVSDMKIEDTHEY